MIEPTIDFKYFRSGFRKGHVIGVHGLGRFVTGFGGKVAPPFNRFYMGGENDIRGFDIWGISPMAYIPSSADGPGLQQRRSAAHATLRRCQRRRTVSSPLTQRVPTYQLIFPGGDTQVVTNFEYRIPIFGPVILAALLRCGSQQDLTSRSVAPESGAG